ncbi:hypothetical protein [Fusobacterium sp.]|uniref:hypothetical protein n=1 Tax=Fusobacterium sp. TaxID=68766 RepID=UPI002A80D3FA|nr:hypothetical protein [Fusobacterium sp.]
MIKKMIILIVMGLTLSSCQLFTEAIKDNIYRVEREREKKELSKKDGPGAIVVDEYKEGVERATQDIMKRPVNKKVQFEGATFIIPENTRINPKHGNIVDEKTGYGIFISFSINSHYTNISKIAKEIMRINGFKDTCK